MNLKERGFSIGYLFIILRVLLISLFFFNRVNEEKNKTASLNNFTSIKNLRKSNWHILIFIMIDI